MSLLALFSLNILRFAGTKSRAKFNEVRLHSMRNAKLGGFFISEPLTLSNLFRSPRSHKARKRYRGDGTGSRLNGRGSKGQKSRSGNSIPRGFEGGQTELRFRMPRKSKALKQLERTYDGFGRIHLDQIKRWIDIGRLDASKPLTLSSFYDAGLISIRRGLLITDGGSEYFTYRVHIEATEFTPEAIARIEELGGKAIAVYHSIEDIKLLTRPDFYFFTEARRLVIFKKYIGALSSHLSRRDLPSLSVEALKQRLNPSELYAFLMNGNIEVDRVLQRRNMVKFSLLDVFGEKINGEPNINELVDRNSIRKILKGKPESLSAKLISEFLPPFSSPTTHKDIKFYTSDEKRGYLSNYILDILGSDETKSGASISSPIHFGLKYWIDRKYVVATRDHTIYDSIVKEYNWINVFQNKILEKERKRSEEILERDRIISLLQEKGLKLDVPRFIGPKEPWRIKKEGPGEVFLLPIDYNPSEECPAEPKNDYI